MPESVDIRRLIQGLPCRVRLPEQWVNFFAHVGPLPPHYGDERQFPRFFCRTEAALTCCHTLPTRPRDTGDCRVYVKDISRRAISFLHSEQLFPCERVRLRLPDDIVRPLVVVRCRKVQALCYEVAGHFGL